MHRIIFFFFRSRRNIEENRNFVFVNPYLHNLQIVTLCTNESRTYARREMTSKQACAREVEERHVHRRMLYTSADVDEK